MDTEGLNPGVWWLKSQDDPRWNAGGPAKNLEFGVSIDLPPEAAEILEDMKSQFGEPPEDLEFGGMKD